VLSFAPGSHKAENIHASVKTSFELLGVSKVHILYLHSPDRATPFEETLRAINDEYEQGIVVLHSLSLFCFVLMR
jgi:aflatoxin B1 aldehyde reductase